MTIAPWRSPLARNLHEHRTQPQARFLQLATICTNGYPANRTVVFRGFLETSDRLMFVTDARSQKLSQIEQNNKCEACWYFPNTREQFRIAGHLEAISNGCTDPVMQAARFAAWQALSDPARMQFAWPPPCQLRTEDTLAFALPPPDPAIPLPNFCLLLLNPEQVDRLELRGKPQNRWLYRLEAPGTWSMQAINP